MKKFLCIVLCLFPLFSVVGCSSTPSQFSNDLKKHTQCYIDAIRIEPYAYSGDLNLYCQCTLSDQSTVFMLLSEIDYETFFDPGPSEDSYDYFLKGVSYDSPVRIHGVVKTADVQVGSIAKESKIFFFKNADSKLTLNRTQYVYSSTPLTETVSAQQFAKAQIVGLEVTGVISDLSISSSYITDLTCTCTTDDGKTITVTISKNDYDKYISPGAVIRHDPINPVYPDPVDFAWPVDIYGITNDTNGTSMTVKEADYEKVEEAKIENQPAVEFTHTLKPKQQAYATVIRIKPEFSVGRRFLGSMDYACRCQSSNGKEFWLYLSASELKENFLNTFVESNWENVEVTLNPTKISGYVADAENLVSTLSDSIGEETIMVFDQKE